MKLEIIANKPQNTVSLNDPSLTDNKFYGILYTSLGQRGKGFVTRPNYRGGEYRFLCLTGLTQGNHLMGEGDLQTVIGSQLVGDNQIFVFDTAKELMAWLAEDIK